MKIQIGGDRKIEILGPVGLRNNNKTAGFLGFYPLSAFGRHKIIEVQGGLRENPEAEAFWVFLVTET